MLFSHLELVARLLELELHRVRDPVQAGRHARLQHVHEPPAERVRADEQALVVPAALVKVPRVLAVEVLLLTLEHSGGDAPVAGAQLAEDAASLGRLAHHADIPEVQGVLVAADDLRSKLRGHQVHFRDNTNGTRAERVDPAGRTESRRVGEVDIGGAHGENNVRLANVLVAQGGNLFFERLGLVERRDLDIAREVDEGKVRDVRGVDVQLDGLVRDAHLGRDSEVEVRQRLLDRLERRHLAEVAHVGEHAVLYRLALGGRRVDEGELDRPPCDHVVALGEELVPDNRLQHRALSRRLRADNNNRGELERVALVHAQQHCPDLDKLAGELEELALLSGPTVTVSLILLVERERSSSERRGPSRLLATGTFRLFLLLAPLLSPRMLFCCRLAPALALKLRRERLPPLARPLPKCLGG